MVLAAVTALTVVAVVIGWFTHPVITVLAALGLVALVGVAARWRQSRTGGASLVNRWSVLATKNRGIAGGRMVLRRSSSRTIRRNITRLLPTSKSLPPQARSRIPANHFSTRIIKVGGVWLRSSIRQHTITFGGPQKGKSGTLADKISEAPGPVLATSTDDDLINNTMAVRSQLGPVTIFNPCGVGGVASTVAFDLLKGCEDHSVAIGRASDLLEGTPMSDSRKNPEWVKWGSTALAALLHAAAVGGGTLEDVHLWVAVPDEFSTQVLRHLQGSPAAMLHAVQFFTAGESRSSYIMTMMPALEWLASPTASACAKPGHNYFDVEKFLASRGTIYLLAEPDGVSGPLVNAFVRHIVREARRIAKQRPGRCLEPVFTIVPDEAPLICPMNLPKETANLGKLNISVHVGAQSISQIRDRWGADGAGKLFTNCATVTMFSGTKDPVDLATLSLWSGGALTPERFMQLPDFHAVVFRDGVLPAVGKPPMVWDRPDYRRNARAAVWATRLRPGRELAESLTGRWRRHRAPVAPTKPMLALPVGPTAKKEGWKPGITTNHKTYSVTAREPVTPETTKAGGKTTSNRRTR